MKSGTTRIVFLIGSFAFKFPRIRRWKIFLRGMLANIDERMWYKNSPPEWKSKLSPSLFSLAGFLLISRRARPLTLDEYYSIDPKFFHPLPFDMKLENFGMYEGRIVLVDYADSRYFCSNCEKTLCLK